MKALRIALTQTSANYKKEETIDNAMTYPLPPFSTVSSAIHSACGWKELKKMGISIQGEFESMRSRYYTAVITYNNAFDDRGTLVKMCSTDSLSNAYTVVAKALVKGSSYKRNKGIHISDAILYKEYMDLKAEKIKISNEIDQLKQKIKEKEDISLIPEYQEEKKKCEKRKEEIQHSISFYRCIEHIPRRIEILDHVHLILHIRADMQTLDEILSNIYNIKCIGRSEDTVNVINAEIVNLHQDATPSSEYSAYLRAEDARNGNFVNSETDSDLHGTKYYINRYYEIADGKRVFEKAKVIYSSCHKIKEFNDNIYVDNYDGKQIIINFL